MRCLKEEQVLKLVLRTSSLNREKIPHFFLMLCYLDEKVILFCGHRIHIYVIFFQVPITLSTFIFSRFSIPSASLSIQIKPVNYQASLTLFKAFYV